MPLGQHMNRGASKKIYKNSNKKKGQKAPPSDRGSYASYKQGKEKKGLSVKNHQLSNPSPRQPVGARAERDNLREASKIRNISLNAERVNNLCSYQMSGVGESKETLLVPVNPQLLFQFIYGVVMGPISITDDPGAGATAACVAYTIMRSFSDLEDTYANVAFPLAIVRLRKALDARTIGKYSYASDWSAVKNFVLQLQAPSGLYNAPTADASYPSASISGGFYGRVDTGTALDGVNENELSRFFGSYPSHYRCVSFADVVDDKTDASAFSFDVGPVPQTNPSNLTVLSVVGYVNSSATKLYIKQNGIYGNETRCKQRDLASLRLGTPALFQANPTTPNQQVNSLNYNRNPNYTDEALGLPSVIGWASRAGGPRGQIILKPVPAVSCANAIIARLEAIVQAANVTTTFQTTFSSNEIKMLVYGWLRAYMRQYSGAYYGTWLATVSGDNATVNMFYPSAPEYHYNTQITAFCRIPEYVARLFGAIAPSQGKAGLLIPWFATSTPDTYVTSLAYKTEVITFPSTAGVSGSGNKDAYFQSSLYAGIVARYKTFEYQLAGFENMAMYGGLGESKLDVTLGVNVSGGLSSIYSRRPISDKLFYSHMAVSPAITYDATESSNIAFPLFAVSKAIHNKDYSTNWRRELAGNDTLSTYSSMFAREGIVVNGFTNNEEGNMSSETTYEDVDREWPLPRGQRLLKEVTPSLKATVYKLAARLIPRKGNYCGPGWTAGVETAMNDPAVLDGKYQVKPTDDEDAICKTHDEAYRRDNSLSGQAKADKEMAKALDQLARTKGLTVYGHAARLSIGLKGELGNGGSPLLGAY